MVTSPTHGFTRFTTAFPEQYVKNDVHPFNAFAKQARRAGIEGRYIIGNGETVESMGIAALQKVLGDSRTCTALVLSTTKADHDVGPRPQESAETIARHFGIDVAHGIDMACSGFSAAIVKALQLAEKHNDIAVVCSEHATRGIDYDNGATAVLFGDGAAATTVSRNGPHKILGAHAEEMNDPHFFLDSERRHCPNFMGQRSDRSVFRMSNGRDLAELAGITMAENAIAGLKDEEEPDDNILVVPHQASGPVLDQVDTSIWNKADRRLRIERHVQRTGNTVSAGLPIALAAIQDSIKTGTLVLCPTVGGGEALRPGKLSQGLVRIRW